jgi:predicted TIM-barrel fold metal-dependent hydrolase
MRDIPASIAELTYWAEKDSNVVGVLIPPACPDGRLLDNPELHPLFQRAQDLDLPILVHGGVLRPPYTAGATELDNSGFLIRAMYQPWSGMAAVGALIGGGVLDTFDKLRIGVFETGGGWMPWLIEALDGSYQGRGRLTPFLGRPPSEVVAEGRLFHAVEGGDQQLNNCIEALGEDIWLFATDYPHTGSPWPFGVNEVTDRSDMAADVKNKILGANAMRLCPRIAG